MTTLQINDQSFILPTSWADMSEVQRVKVWQILNDDLNDYIPNAAEINFMLLRVLIATTGISYQYLQEWKEEDELAWISDMDIILEQLSWLFETSEDGHKSIAPVLLSNPFTTPMKIKKNWHTVQSLIGPNHDMSNVLFGELIKIFTIVERLDPDATDAARDELWAVMWRPFDDLSEAYDQRIPFVGHEFQVEHRLSYADQIFGHIKDMILFWAQCVRKRYADQFQNIFKAVGIEGERSGNDYAWAGVIMALAQDVTKINDVQTMAAEDVMVYLSYMEDERIRAEMASKNP